MPNTENERVRVRFTSEGLRYLFDLYEDEDTLEEYSSDLIIGGWIQGPINTNHEEFLITIDYCSGESELQRRLASGEEVRHSFLLTEFEIIKTPEEKTSGFKKFMQGNS